MITDTAIGLTAGLLTSIAMLPQLIKVLKEEDTSGLSVVTISVLVCGLALWVWYGIRRNELPIVLTNAFALLLNLTLLLTCFLYRNHKKA